MLKKKGEGLYVGRKEVKPNVQAFSEEVRKVTIVQTEGDVKHFLVTFSQSIRRGVSPYFYVA